MRGSFFSAAARTSGPPYSSGNRRIALLIFASSARDRFLSSGTSFLCSASKSCASSSGPACAARASERNTATWRSEEHTSELQSRLHLVCRLLLEKKKLQHALHPA